MFLYLLILAEFIFFALGIYLPMLVVSEFWFFKNEISLLKIIQGLFENNELILTTVVATFGVFLPVMRMVGRILNFTALEKIQLHKFSMLDIFLLSFIVFAGKFSAIFSAEIAVGFYFLLSSVLVGFLKILLESKKRK